MHAENQGNDLDGVQQDITKQYEIVERKAWESR